MPEEARTDNNAKLFLMIIKGLFRRYQRWNPVHPTLGTFWGMGIGIGCGVGWGPGFGPEVIGYVGAGCGVGFSVGITLVGVGIGLPQNGLHQIPYNAFAASTSSEFARTYAVAVLKSLIGNGRELRERFLSFKEGVRVPERVDFTKLNTAVSGSIKSTVECLGAFKNQHWPPGKVT